MTIVPANLLYTKEHEWVKVHNGVATIGITDYAQEQLGDIVYVELPALETEFEEMNDMGVVESVKTVSNLYCPLSGIVTKINDDLVNDPGLVNSSPYDEGWIVKIKIADDNEVSDLLSAEEYEGLLEESN